MDLMTSSEAIITLTVNRYMSITQGKMVTSGANPDVISALTQNTGNRVTRLNNGSFQVTGGNPQGNNPLVLRIEVLPKDDYAAVGLVIRNVHNISEGGVVSWDSFNVGTGANDNSVVVKDNAPLPAGTSSITYELYMLIKPRAAVADLPLGDIGMIDPLITNL